MQASAALAAVATLTAHLSVGYNPVRPWQQKWQDVEIGLRVLEAFYARDDANNEDVRREVEDFFKACRELADWLEQHAGKPEAMTYVNSDPDLMICDGMAQTIKHHTRNSTRRDPITARVSWVRGGPLRAEIEWTRPSGARGTEDALDLARRCVAAWEQFFRQHGLDPAA